MAKREKPDAIKEPDRSKAQEALLLMKKLEKKKRRKLKYISIGNMEIGTNRIKEWKEHYGLTKPNKEVARRKKAG